MKKPTKRDCAGCYNDVYNHGCGGAKQCWFFATATMEKKYDIHVDAMPPFKGLKPTIRPSCYKAKRWARVDASAITKDGYWTR